MHWHAILSDLFGPGTWGTAGNIVAAVLLGALSAVAAYLGRHRIGRGLAAWWSKHHGPYAIAQHQEALRRHEEAKHDAGGDAS